MKKSSNIKNNEIDKEIEMQYFCIISNNTKDITGIDKYEQTRGCGYGY